jgi:hypothetical protein
MRVLRRRYLLTGLLVYACTSTLPAAAAEPNPNSTPFGRGVKAYFSGDLAAAESAFAEAIGVDPKDPRPFYFRALCRLREGRRVEARDDFLIAATLEARSRGSYSVGQSLERVQGSDRLVLEQFRWHARPVPAAAPGNHPATTFDRADFAVHTDAGALRQAVSVPLDRLVEPVGLSELREASVIQPLSATTVISDQPSADGASAAGANSADNPFADDPHAGEASKIQSGKLMGIVGRALLQSAPVPSLDGLRDKIPGLPLPSTSDAAAGTDVEFGAATADDPTADDPFPESAPPTQEPESESTDDQPPAESIDEDPFG